MKVLITGAGGQLGADLCRALHDTEIIPLTHVDLEITDLNLVKSMITRHRPDVVINTAAFVRVDDCESEPDTAFMVNSLGAKNLALACQELGAKLAHISTDYVFGGEPGRRTTPYTESDHPLPLNIYGKSKLEGETLVRQLCPQHFIIRTSGLFGTAGSSGKGGNFIETILKRAKEGRTLTVVEDQFVSPTYTADLAQKIAQIIMTDYYGLFHIVNKGACSWYEFSLEILSLASLNCAVTPVSSDQYPQKAIRPRYSVLDNHRLRQLGMDDMRPWQEALKDYLSVKGHVQ